ncbi:hypothetical protein J1N35_040240 [Gossypium stocksii]|uniref:Secreted protein n=1 Tax=Gossypium stocksii TaxID=47602 RepID=A0A9D3UDL5_9ROSI|nr:hypothetical protein J1N35_040240 [Gossypium stocksii]
MAGCLGLLSWALYRMSFLAAVYAEAHIWCINTPVLNFSTVEWYNGDQVMLQFGCRQFLPVE